MESEKGRRRGRERLTSTLPAWAIPFDGCVPPPPPVQSTCGLWNTSTVAITSTCRPAPSCSLSSQAHRGRRT